MVDKHTKLWKSAVETAIKKIDGNLVPFADVYPDDTSVGNIYQPRRARNGFAEGSNFDWTTSFWPGMIWLAYELTNNLRYRAAGEHHIASFKERIEKKIDVDNHDLGFLYSLTGVAPWLLTGNTEGRRIALMAADQLLTRYLEIPGIIQAWGRMDDTTEMGRTILDSVMNLPLLYWAAKETGKTHYYENAYRHARQLRDHFVRPDGSTFHTFIFDPQTGKPLRGKQAGGATEDSCWTRGSAWAIYGFPLSYKYTHDTSFLNIACRVADYFINNLPADQVPYWDFSFNDASDEAKDSSAASIAVCGLLELARQLPHGSQSEHYRNAGLKILSSLCIYYAAPADSNTNGLLLHGVYGGRNRHGYDECNLWGDYYYLEALTRMLKPDWKPYW
jgi:unsaturated chondroitin disaccharide hydrolase